MMNLPSLYFWLLSKACSCGQGRGQEVGVGAECSQGTCGVQATEGARKGPCNPCPSGNPQGGTVKINGAMSAGRAPHVSCRACGLVPGDTGQQAQQKVASACPRVQQARGPGDPAWGGDGTGLCWGGAPGAASRCGHLRLRSREGLRCAGGLHLLPCPPSFPRGRSRGPGRRRARGPRALTYFQPSVVLQFSQ